MARIIRTNKYRLWSPRSIIFHPYTNTSTRSIESETVAFEEIRSASHNPSLPCHHSAIFLHGLMGTARNWRSFSRNLASSLSTFSPSSDWKMVLVDLRNHAHSTGVSSLQPPHDMINAANDVAYLVKSKNWNWPDVVLGHSMGGKVALQYAMSCARGDYGTSAKLPKQLWVLDCVPGIQANLGTEIMLETLQSLPKPIPSCKWLVDHLNTIGFPKTVSEWIGSLLKKSGEHETWSFDLEGVIQMFDSYRKLDYWPLLEHPPKGMEIVIVRAENSDEGWDPHIIQNLARLENRKSNESEGKVSVVVLPKSGHWVHVDNPIGLVEILTPKIASLS